MLFLIVRGSILEASSKAGAGKFYASIIIGVVILLIFDRITKYLAVIYLKDTAGITLIDGVLRFTYLENKGAAFGLFQGMQSVFIVLTVAFLIVCVWFFKKTPRTKRYAPLNVCVLFLAAGAIGNFVDRVMQQYVVDFIYFEIIDFPVFNVADIYVTVSVIVFIVLMLFYYKEGEFAFLSSKKKEYKNE